MDKLVRSILGGVVFCVLQNSAYADTTAFGMTLGKTTLEEFRKAYPSSTHEGKNKWTEGQMYSIPVSELDFEGVKSDLIIFNKDGKIAAITLDIDKERFSNVNAMLSKKYKIIKKEIPFVGNKYARYKNDNDFIELDAPHLSFSMSLLYIEKSFEDAYLKMNAEEKNNKKTKELDKL